MAFPEDSFESTPGAYVTLDSIVARVADELGYDTIDHLYFKFLNHARQVLKTLYWDTVGSFEQKTVILDVDEQRDQAVLPKDYVKYTKIGFMGTDGKIYEMGSSDQLLVGTYDPCTGAQKEVASKINAYTFPVAFSNYYDSNSGGYGFLWGERANIGGGVPYGGSYRVDNQRGVIELSDLATTQIILEYKYNPDYDAVTRDTKVHVYAEEAVLAGIVHHFTRNKSRSYSMGDREMFRQNFAREKKMARTRITRFTPGEFRQAIRKHYGGYPKW